MGASQQSHCMESEISLMIGGLDVEKTEDER